MLKKILMISNHDIWGDLNTFSPMLKILQGLSAEGVHVDFVSTEKTKAFDEASQKYGEPVEYIAENISINRIRILPPSLLKALYKNSLVKRVVSKLITEVLFPARVYNKYKNCKDYDIVYGYEIYGVKVAKKLSLKYGKPLVTRFQGSFIKSWEDKFGIDFCKKKYKLHYQALSTKADLIIMTNDGTEGDKTLRALNNDENMRFWRNGFDFSPLPESKAELRERLGLQQDVFYTVSVCRLAKWKRCERIVEAYKNIAVPSERIKHIFVGDGEERENLENMIHSYGLDDYFVFCGSQPHEKVKEYLQASDSFLSFFDSTNSGNPLIEAVKINLPIVTYDVGDTGTVIENGKNGIMLETPDPERIAREIEALLSDEALRSRLIEGTKKSSAMFYSWETRVENELKELKRIVK